MVSKSHLLKQEDGYVDETFIQTTSTRDTWWMLAALSLLMGFASISTDLYLPAMPTMQESLDASSGVIEWTVTGFLIGLSIGQLFWGPISDRYGRRFPLIVGMALFIIGSLGCALSNNVSAILAWRVLQALGASAGVVLSRAMVRDLYDGNRAAQILSILIAVMAIAPLVGPLIGGQILMSLGWCAIFWTLVAVGFLTLIIVYVLPETLNENYQKHESLPQAFSRYGYFVNQRHILVYAAMGAFFYSGIFAYVAGSPFVYIEYYHILPSHYGWLFGLGVIGIMAGNLMNRKLLKIHPPKRVVIWGSIVCALSAGMLIASGLIEMGGIAGLLFPIVVFLFMNGFVVTNSIALAMEYFPDNAGTISALLGALVLKHYCTHDNDERERI